MQYKERIECCTCGKIVQRIIKDGNVIQESIGRANHNCVEGYTSSPELLSQFFLY